MVWSREQNGPRPLFRDGGSYETPFVESMERSTGMQSSEIGPEAVRLAMRPLSTGYAERHGEEPTQAPDVTPEGLNFSA